MQGSFTSDLSSAHKIKIQTFSSFVKKTNTITIAYTTGDADKLNLLLSCSCWHIQKMQKAFF